VKSNWEYHGKHSYKTVRASRLPKKGPRSYLSICSRPGIRWVIENTGSSAFDDIARSFTKSLTQILKIQRNLSADRHEEPDPPLARTYAQGPSPLLPPSSAGTYLSQLILMKPQKLHSQLFFARSFQLGLSPISAEHQTMIELGML
jgi:hypothetical protein